MAYEIPIVVRERCCSGGCDGVTADTATCWEVYEPGRSLETTNRFWMFPNDGIVRNALNNGAAKWTPYDSPYETDCFATGGGDPQTHVSGASLRKVSWEKMAGCGPYLLTGFFGDDPVISTATSSTTETPNDLRWFETLGYVKATSPGFWRIRPCTRPYYLAEDGPTCLYVDGEMFQTQVPVVIESVTDSNCNITLGYSDLVGQLDGDDGGVITWLISADQVNITVTYTKGVDTYTATIPFVREWWLDVLDLLNELDEVVNVYDCDTAPCTQLSCWPFCVAKACDDVTYVKDIYFSVSGCECLNVDAGLASFGGAAIQFRFGSSEVAPRPCAYVNVQYSCSYSGSLIRLVSIQGRIAGITTYTDIVLTTCAGGEWTDSFTLDPAHFQDSNCTSTVTVDVTSGGTWRIP